MKICYLCPDHGISIDGFKGASSHLRGFIQELTNLGHEVDLLSPNNGTLPLPLTLQAIPRKKNERAYRALKHLLSNGTIETTLTNYIEEKKPDLIYERLSPFSAAGSAIAKHFEIPHLIEVNAPLAEQGKLFRDQALQEASELMESAAIHSAGGIVVLTDELKNWVMDQGIPENKILMKPCAVDTSLFCPEGPAVSFPGKKVIGFVGSLKPWHDIKMIIETFRVLSKDPSPHLVIIGDGPMLNVLEELKNELPSQVTLTGAIEQQEIPAYIRAMDVVVAPYPDMELFYFSPLKIFEAMAMGKPIVSTAIGQIKTLLPHGQSGLLVPPGDKEAFVQAINTLLNDKDLSDRIGQNALKSVQQKHTWAIRTKQWIEDVKKFF